MWQRAPRDNKHRFVWIPGHKPRGGKFKATDEQRERGDVKWLAMIRALVQVLMGKPDASGKVLCNNTLMLCVHIYLGDIRFMPMRSRITFFQGFLNFLSNAPKFRSVGGGGGVCIYFLKSVRKGRFRNVGLGGARWSHF